jgi:hypothetical protein
MYSYILGVLHANREFHKQAIAKKINFYAQFKHYKGSRGSAVYSIVSDYKLDDRAIEVRSPTETKNIPLASVSRPALGPPSLLPNGYRGSFSGAKARPGRDADHSSPI